MMPPDRYELMFFGIVAAFVVFLAIFTALVIIPSVAADDRCSRAGGVPVRSWEGHVCVPKSSLIHP